MDRKTMMKKLYEIEHDELKVILKLITDDWNDCIDALDTMQIRAQIELQLSGLKENAEFGSAVKWGAQREMFATNKSGLALVLERYREAHSKEAQEGMCPDCGEAMALLRYHEEGYPIFWCTNCEPDGPY